MKKAIIFGLGNTYTTYKSYLFGNYKVIGLVDNNLAIHGRIVDGITVIPPEKIRALEYDVVILMLGMPESEKVVDQLKELSVPLESIIRSETIKSKKWLMQYRAIFGEYIRPKSEKLISSVCRPTDLESIPEWSSQLANSNIAGLYTQDRKTWEFVYICQALKERGMLAKGKRGLVFAVGRELLPTIFAGYGCKITATDAPIEISIGWDGSNQHSNSINDLYYPHIIEKKQFLQNVAFRYADMKNIPEDLVDYDFIWTSCALEHLGSMHTAKEFIYRAMNCLKPGGIAVHTTEYNLKSSVETLNMGNVSAMRSVDLIEVAEHLAWQGHFVEPLDFRLDGSTCDNEVALYPYSEHHFKLFFKSHILTSFGLIIRKGNI